MANKYIQNQKFFPDLFLGLVNPHFFARRGLYKGIKENTSFVTGDVLDVGCGSKPYMGLFNYNSYIGVDIENPGHDHKNENIDIFYDGKTLPFDDSSFDSIICNQVLEHVFNPAQFLNELNRVSKKNGSLLLTVPFIWDEHEQPYDFGRYSSYGLTHLLRENGFEIINHKKATNSFAVINQLANNFFYKKFYHKKNIAYKFLAVGFFVFNNLIGLFFSFLLPSNDDLYLDNIVIAKNNKNN